MNSLEMFHSIRAITLMTKLALFEKKYHEVFVLMTERTDRIERWAQREDSGDSNLICQLVLETKELEQEIERQTSEIAQTLKSYAEMIPARRAYAQAQAQASLVAL
ncbi:hypothetical protein D2Q93_11465 [Alicyclobacillaceae bacterium I2511]|nr:hypothetical protein D2Q93_11465 [Alicyclobacillaceae bacterium I2511]